MVQGFLLLAEDRACGPVAKYSNSQDIGHLWAELTHKTMLLSV